MRTTGESRFWKDKNKMDEDLWRLLLTAYRQGATADFLWSRDDAEGAWGPVWTIPPCSPDAARRVARQFARVRPRQIQHARRALVYRSGSPRKSAVVIVTVLPIRLQTVRSLADGERLEARYLEDEVLRVFAAIF